MRNELKTVAGMFASYQSNDRAVHSYSGIAAANFRFFLQALPVAFVLHTSIESIAVAFVN